MLLSWYAVKHKYLSPLMPRLSFRWKIGIFISLLSVSITSLGFYYYYTASYQIAFSLLQKNLRGVGNVGVMLFDKESREALKRLKKRALEEAQFDRQIIDALQIGGTTRTISAEKIKELHASDDFQTIWQRLRMISYASFNESISLQSNYEITTGDFDNGIIATYLMIDLTDILSEDFGMYIGAICPEPNVTDEWAGNPIGNMFRLFVPFSKLNQKSYVHHEIIEDDFYQGLSASVPILDENNQTIALLGLDYSVGPELGKLHTLKSICFRLIIVSLLLSLLISFFISKSLNTPLKKLYNAAKKVSQEDYTALVDIKSKDEFELLGQVFNKMLADIQSSFHKLESFNENLKQIVVQKTEALQHSNGILDKQAKDLAIVLQNREDFYLRTAHELRTPLTLIRTPVEQLLEEDAGAAKNNNLIIIQRAVFRLQRLVDQMLQVSISGSTFEVGVQSIDLTSTLIPIFELYSKSAEKKNINLIIEPIPSSAVSLNKTVLIDIIHNLVSNALKYSPPGSRILIRVSLEADHLHLVVKDNGLGIAPKSISNIFEPHFREDETGNSDEGYGIGLHTVKQHLARCKGAIEVKSTLGKGSTFTVTLPCSSTIEKRSEHTALQDDRLNPHWEHNLPQVGNKQPLLIIEDDADMQQVLKNLLQGQYEIAIAGNVKQGLQQAIEKNPLLILCDVMLPDGSGFDIISKVKQNQETSHIPIIILTAIGDLPGQKQGWEKGADDYVIKPFANDDLLLRIVGLLENRKRLRAWYQQKFLLGQNDANEEISVNNSEIDYLNKLTVEAHRLLKEGNCRLEPLARSMGQSRRTLQRRLEHLLNQNFTEYIKSIQLKLAQQFLTQGFSVKETAYEVGFKDPAYFSKTFKKQFGLSPREFHKRTAKSRQQSSPITP